MPRGDGTGPNGAGAMTGRGMGYCAGFNAPGFANAGAGRGFRRGFGRGRGFGRQSFVPTQSVQPTVITEQEQKQFLEEDLKGLKQEMEEIQKRLKELK